MSSLGRKFVRQQRASGKGESKGEATSSGHQFVVLGKYHRNQQNAEDYVDALFQQAASEGFVHELPNGKKMVKADRGSDAVPFVVEYLWAVSMARETGTVETLRTLLNRNDPYFVFTLGLAGDGEGAEFNLTFAGRSMMLKSPGRQMAIESELTDDILQHRIGAAGHSRVGTEGPFELSARHYRGYLLSCCALVEAFLNRSVIIDIDRGIKSQALAELEKPCRVERKFELWLEHFCGERLSSINNGAEWSQYKELVQRRNSLVHAADTMLGIGLKDMVRQLNLVRLGVGGLINRLRALQQLSAVSFAERLETAPEARFISRV